MGKTDKPKAICHVDRNVHSQGLCRPCYDKQRRNAKKANCHPQKLHVAKGLCRSCYNNLPENIERARQVRRLKKYGLKEDDYQRMLSRSGGLCQICGASANAIDHNHMTKKVRGLLCTACNAALGLFKESTTRLCAAIVYLMLDEGEQVAS